MAIDPFKILATGDGDFGMINQGGKYSLQYPTSLDTSPEYGSNRVVFFINVPGNSKIAMGEQGGGKDDYRLVTTDVPAGSLAKGNKDSTAATKELIDQTATLIGAKDITRLVNTAPKRLGAAISLYVPNQVSTSWSVNWSDEDMGGNWINDIAGLVLTAANKSVSEAASEGWDLIKDRSARSLVAGNDYLGKTLGITPGNAKAEQLFRSVGFREIRFDYEFKPRSRGEAQACLDIIRMFRHHMLPEYLNSTEYMYIYPSTFDIKYFIGDNENEFLEKHLTAVLTHMSVEYSDGTSYSTFEDGMPTTLKMSLNFTEIGLPTKESSPFDRSGA